MMKSIFSFAFFFISLPFLHAKDSKIYFQLSSNFYASTPYVFYSIPARNSQLVSQLNRIKIAQSFPISTLGIGKEFDYKFLKSIGIQFANFKLNAAGPKYAGNYNTHIFELKTNIYQMGLNLRLFESKNDKFKFYLGAIFTKYIGLRSSTIHADTQSLGSLLPLKKAIKITADYGRIPFLFTPIIETGIEFPLIKLRNKGVIKWSTAINIYTYDNIETEVLSANSIVIQSSDYFKSLNFGLKYVY